MPHARHDEEVDINHRASRFLLRTTYCARDMRSRAQTEFKATISSSIRIVWHASNNARKLRCVSTDRPAPGPSPPTLRDNERQMYRLICQYCPTFVFTSSVCLTRRVGSPPYVPARRSMMTFVSWPLRHCNSSGWNRAGWRILILRDRRFARDYRYSQRKWWFI